ncbi:tRNA (adenosine(37)-N6)-threonylcarbamoyltransferase complex ATPase subunit type 1 TsaE [Pontimicrobium sp. IMCC45349]|uniref:tRNA (adenosine(37)-N6)-threonylcarbamoyltransferase complex ATPase subunit type 1 TsaE n=1 Tax=Pontimicrobium sp. IMCC45349 TaxID=3391574 RepID=UPI0039A2C3FE
MELNFDINSIEEVAKSILEKAKSKTILFYGEMGVGKTTLINELVKQLGGLMDTSSPTFSIVNEYEIKDDIVYHFDFYRIEDEYEALDLGIEEYFYSNRWVFIEWPEKIDVLLPENVGILRLKLNKNGTRNLSFQV